MNFLWFWCPIFCCSKVFQNYEFSTCKTSQRYCSYYHEARVILVTIPTLTPIRFLLLFLLLLGRKHNSLFSPRGALALWFFSPSKALPTSDSMWWLWLGWVLVSPCTCWQIYKTSTCFQVHSRSHLLVSGNTETQPFARNLQEILKITPHFKTLNCGKIHITYSGLGRSPGEGNS